MITEYQKIKNLLDDTTNQRSKFRTRNWIEKTSNDESREHIMMMMMMMILIMMIITITLNLKPQW